MGQDVWQDSTSCGTWYNTSSGTWNDTNTTTTQTIQFVPTTEPSKTEPEREGPVEWLEGRVEEMCEKGRHALRPAA